jgi:predicted transcriptional regulator of viral defense system
MVTAREQLWDIALDQYGYVTQVDASCLGIDRPTVDLLNERGQLERVGHGVYRFPQLPVTTYDRFMLAVLWTGTGAACLSHDTALAAYNVCDIDPDRIHVTIPTARRVRRSDDDLYDIHQQDLADEQIGWWQQIQTVTLPTAISQCIDSGVPEPLLRQALTTARNRGELTAPVADALERDLDARDDAG